MVVLIIFPVILQTVINFRMLSIGELQIRSAVLALTCPKCGRRKLWQWVRHTVNQKASIGDTFPLANYPKFIYTIVYNCSIPSYPKEHLQATKFTHSSKLTVTHHT